MNNIELLNNIYNNAYMLCIDINNIIVKVNNEKLEKILNNELEEYLNIIKETKDVFKKYGKQEKLNNSYKILNNKIVNELKLLKDKNIAKLVIEKTNTNIIDIIENINKYSDSDVEIITLGNKLKATLEKNLNELKKYL